MNGAQKLIETAVAAGVDVCFSNPGTTEMELVAALDTVPGMRPVLALFEGVATGAADGYGRMADRPAFTLLHLGPGFANGMANLHNARRARTPIVNLIGHHATWQRNFDPPLNSEVEQLAAPVSNWLRTNASAGQLSRDAADAIAAARRHPGAIATLVVPTDSQWNEAPDDVAQVQPPRGARVDDNAIERARAALEVPGRALLLLGQHGLREAGLRAAARIAQATGCALMSETFPKRLERGPHLPALDRLPYVPEQATEALAPFQRVVLAGCSDPVAFFGYRGLPSRLIPDGVKVTVLAGPEDDAGYALQELADAIEAPRDLADRAVERPARPSGALTSASIAQAVAAVQPEGAIVVDEGVTSAGAYYPLSHALPAHTYLALTGGAIGWGMPCGTGAAIACPERRVIVLEGDGSGLYTVQALWTQARERLDVVNVVFNNSVYRILQIELMRAGVTEPGPKSHSLTDLSRPVVDWVSVARGFGVPATRATSAEELTSQLERALAARGPHLIEVVLNAAPGLG